MKEVQTEINSVTFIYIHEKNKKSEGTVPLKFSNSKHTEMLYEYTMLQKILENYINRDVVWIYYVHKISWKCGYATGFWRCRSKGLEARQNPEARQKTSVHLWTFKVSESNSVIFNFRKFSFNIKNTCRESRDNVIIPLSRFYALTAHDSVCA